VLAPPPHGFHDRYGPGHWLWQPAPQYSGPCPQNPYWLQQLGGWHGAPPAWTPHSPAFTAAARGAPLALASDPAILGTEPTKAELATAKAIGAHGAASLDTALRSRLHRRCSNRGTPLAVALAAKTAVGRAGPAKAELAAA